MNTPVSVANNSIAGLTNPMETPYRICAVTERVMSPIQQFRVPTPTTIRLDPELSCIRCHTAMALCILKSPTRRRSSFVRTDEHSIEMSYAYLLISLISVLLSGSLVVTKPHGSIPLAVRPGRAKRGSTEASIDGQHRNVQWKTQDFRPYQKQISHGEGREHRPS